MTSLFNSVVGYDPLCGVVLTALGIPVENIPRFRDAYVDLKGLADFALVIMTRTGGGNREEYAEQNEWMKQQPGFFYDHDDDFDSTFAHFYYRCPDRIRQPFSEMLARIQEDGYDFPAPMTRFKRALGQIDA